MADSVQTQQRPTGGQARGKDAASAPRPSWIRRLIAGGSDGNERLTTLTGLALIVLTAALGVTIIRIGQLLWLHLFLGLLVIGPVSLKLASTGYRFVRYYTADPAYRRKGPPAPWLRALGPIVVLTTAAVFVTGVLLLILGPSSRQPWVLIHKVSFIAWIVFTALHVLGHLPEIGRYLRTAAASRREVLAVRAPAQGETSGAIADLPGRGGRALSLSAALAVGLVLALVLIPQFATWTHAARLHH